MIFQLFSLQSKSLVGICSIGSIIFHFILFTFLVSELGKLFPFIPLVAEEDSTLLRSSNLVNSVLNKVTDKANSREKQLTEADVLDAIDRGGKDAFSFGCKPATYWVYFFSFFFERPYWLYLHKAFPLPL